MDNQSELAAEGLLDRVRAVVPLIEAGSFRTEAQRKPLDDSIHALEKTGVFRAFVPRRFGGYEIDLETFFDIGVAVSEVCPSTGWITTFYMEHNWGIARFPEDVQKKLFGPKGYILAPGSISPTGEAKLLPDGSYEVSGRWKFASGLMHADWVMLNGKVEVEGAEPQMRMFLVPADKIEVIDTWFVDGMAGTGSNDMAAKSVIVPPEFVSPLPSRTLPTAAASGSYLERIPGLPFASLTACIPAFGCARRALKLFEARMFERVMYGSGVQQSQRSAAQMRLANTISEMRATEAAMRDIVREMQAHADGKIDLSPIAQMQMRLGMAQGVRRCSDIVRNILLSSGSKAHFLDQELQRLQRDVNMISAHTVFDVDRMAEDIGRELVRLHGQ